MHNPSLAILLVGTLAPCAHAQWSTPALVANLNSASAEAGGGLTADGLTIYFASARNNGMFKIFTATRAARYGAFGPPTQVMELSGPGAELRPWPRSDNLEIFFQRGSPWDLWRAERSSTSVPFNAPVPVTELNSPVDDVTPSLSLDGLRIYFASGRQGGSHDIWTATRPSLTSPFGAPTRVTELSTTSQDIGPCISPEGLVIFFASLRPGGRGGYDIWMASRLDTASPFGNVVNVTALNTASDEGAPAFSLLHDEIFFHSGGLSFADLFTARFTGLVASGIAGVSSNMDLRFSDPSAPGLLYVGACALGTSPGIRIDTRVLPLNFDALLQLTAGGLPPILTGYAGTLNQDGVAGGRISFAGYPGLVGLRFFSAFVVLDTQAPSGIRTISNALEVLVQ
jgi:hypothetical protein